MFVKPSMECNAEAAKQLAEMAQWIRQAAEQGVAAHEVERHLLRKVLEMGALLFNGFLQAVGPGDLGSTVSLEDGRVISRWPEQQSRRLVNVFGQFTLSRCVYGTRPGQKIELAPTDQRLRLPESDVSYLLQEWDQMLGVEHAFGEAAQTLQAIVGVKQPVDTLERGSRRMAQAAPAFRAAQAAPDPATEGVILVASEDNKGVPMVRPVEAVPAGTPAGAHRAKGQKANKKQMACIGCVYSVQPHVRTPEELITALFRDPDRRPVNPPHAQHKRYWAELTREAATRLSSTLSTVAQTEGSSSKSGATVRAQDQVFGHMARDIALRRKPDQVLVHLSDGQRSLETDRQRYLPQGAGTVDILDLMHVLPRLWEAAHLFHAEGSDLASQFVRERLPSVLNGCTAQLIAELRDLGGRHGLRGAKALRLRKLCAFLENNLHRMNYDQYLAAGYPIATGVIEGACRHVIKDRMERAGMRWKVPGAHAMLQLRAIYINGDWAAFQAFRIAQETSRLYPHKEAVDALPWLIAA